MCVFMDNVFKVKFALRGGHVKFNTIQWTNGKIRIIDQTLLPIREEYKDIETVDELIEAIKSLRLRGAPLIGVAGSYGAAIAARECMSINIYGEYVESLFLKIKKIEESRPTAINLKNCINRSKMIINNILNENMPEDKKILADSEFQSLKLKIYDALMKNAIETHKEDERICEQIGIYGNQIINDNETILTICNAGSLATSAWGTALAAIYKAYESGKKIKVYSCETRPLLQGSRLTAYELMKKGIEVTTICDNMAGFLMQQKKIDKIIVGADRICRNGDFANKIGTYTLAVLADYHKIPFYVAAPYTTFDTKAKDMEDIPIEERDADEVRKFQGIQTAPTSVNVYNPAFDKTPNKLVSGIITEKGILMPPFVESISKYLDQY